MGERGWIVATCAAGLVGVLALAPARAAVQVVPPGLADQIETLLPSVVDIRTLANSPQGEMFFEGSGFIIEPSGIIVTNRHVIAGSFKITVTIPGIGPLPAEPLYVSEGIDLALLKVNAGRPLPVVKLGDSDSVRIGDSVMVVGNPLGVGESLSFGVVSALNRDIGEGLYDHFIQTDAAINHGNSGGAMFNTAGEVVAINTGLDSSPGNTGSIGIGFAMPINDAKFIINQYLRDGLVVVGSAGVRAQRMTDDLAAAFGLDSARGAIVTEILPDSPATGKLREGDIVLSVNGHDGSDVRAIARLIAETPPGQLLSVTLLRGGVQQTTSFPVDREERDPHKAMAMLGHAPKMSSMVMSPSDPGMGLAKLDAATRQKYALGNVVQGVVVTSVDPKGGAANRVAVGDVIVAVDGVPVHDPLDVEQQLRAVLAQKKPFAALLVRGDNGTNWVPLPLQADH